MCEADPARFEAVGPFEETLDLLTKLRSVEASQVLGSAKDPRSLPQPLLSSLQHVLGALCAPGEQSLCPALAEDTETAPLARTFLRRRLAPFDL